MSTFGNDSVFEIAPQRNCKTSRHRDDSDTSCTSVPPRYLGCVGQTILLMRCRAGSAARSVQSRSAARAHPPVCLFADPLIALGFAAVEGLRHQVDARAYLRRLGLESGPQKPGDRPVPSSRGGPSVCACYPGPQDFLLEYPALSRQFARCFVLLSFADGTRITGMRLRSRAATRAATRAG